MSEHSGSTCSSQTDGDLEGELDEELESEEGRRDERTESLSLGLSASLRAVIRIKQKYQALQRRRQELGLSSAQGTLLGMPGRTSPQIFTFDPLTPHAQSGPLAAQLQKKRKKKKRRVLFPNGSARRTAPKKERSRATYCLYLLCAIVFLQVYNAIENLDDHVLKYDLEGLEKTLRREVYGQQGAVEGLLYQLRDYLSTYVHNKPLVLSVHGPTGVGKSHLGRLLAGHFRSVVGEPLVLQYYTLHHCPLEADAPHCTRNLTTRIADMVERAEEEEKIPLLVFDEAEHMHRELLDTLWEVVGSGQSNEFMNAVYLILSNLGQEHITRHLLHNSSGDSIGITASGRHRNLAKELTPVLRGSLEKLHPLWGDVEFLPMGLLEKSHVIDCFLEEITREGFYPDRANIERLAGEVEYYPAVGGRHYSKTGCKQVVAKVNLL